jgi:ABC-type bacteriocin/lantibiotic exporter with double-glycine peptidase domain
MINFQNVHKFYKKDTHVFKDLNIEITPGEFVVITGAPGTGKTTFLKLILNEVSPNEGDVYYEGIDLDKMSGSQLKEIPTRSRGHLPRIIATSIQNRF